MKRKKLLRAPSRKGATRLVEEKHIGYETIDWTTVTKDEFETKVQETLKHYNYFYDFKDSHKWTIDYLESIKSNNLDAIIATDYWRIPIVVGSFAKMMLNGAKFDDGRIIWFWKKLQYAIDAGKENLAKSKKVMAQKSLPVPVKNKTSDFLNKTEANLDDWNNLKNSSYSMYTELQKLEASYATAKSIVDCYLTLRDQLRKLVIDKDPVLKEAYNHMTSDLQQEYLKFVEMLVSDAEKYMISKKTARKSRKKRTISANAQISNVQYLEKSDEFKINSISPIKIVGSSEVWLFNVRYRTISKLVSSSAASGGFTIKGTTIQNIDTAMSNKKKIRKPEFFFVSVMTKFKLNRSYKNLTTKLSSTTGRINSDTIIVGAF